MGAGILDKILQWGGKRVIAELQGLCTERLLWRVYTERVIWAVESEEAGRACWSFQAVDPNVMRYIVLSNAGT